MIETNIEPVYAISTAARLLGISVHTLRMYEKEGLIVPFKSNGNQRKYSDMDLERLRCIRRAIKEVWLISKILRLPINQWIGIK